MVQYSLLKILLFVVNNTVTVPIFTLCGHVSVPTNQQQDVPKIKKNQIFETFPQQRNFELIILYVCRYLMKEILSI